MVWFAVGVTRGVKCCKHLGLEVFLRFGDLSLGVACSFAFCCDPNPGLCVCDLCWYGVASWCHRGGAGVDDRVGLLIWPMAI